MDEIIDFAALLMKLVTLLLVVVMALTMVAMPHRVIVQGEAMLFLLVPLFVLTTALDLFVLFRPSDRPAYPSQPSLPAQRG